MPTLKCYTDVKELYTKLVIQHEKQLLDLIASKEHVVKYTEFLNSTSEVLFQMTSSQFYFIGFAAQRLVQSLAPLHVQGFIFQ